MRPCSPWPIHPRVDRCARCRCRARSGKATRWRASRTSWSVLRIGSNSAVFWASAIVPQREKHRGVFGMAHLACAFLVNLKALMEIHSDAMFIAPTSPLMGYVYTLRICDCPTSRTNDDEMGLRILAIFFFKSGVPYLCKWSSDHTHFPQTPMYHFPVYVKNL